VQPAGLDSPLRREDAAPESRFVRLTNPHIGVQLLLGEHQYATPKQLDEVPAPLQQVRTARLPSANWVGHGWFENIQAPLLCTGYSAELIEGPVFHEVRIRYDFLPPVYEGKNAVYVYIEENYAGEETGRFAIAADRVDLETMTAEVNRETKNVERVHQWTRENAPYYQFNVKLVDGQDFFFVEESRIRRQLRKYFQPSSSPSNLSTTPMGTTPRNTRLCGSGGSGTRTKRRSISVSTC
jgi:hypothetical protein